MIGSQEGVGDGGDEAGVALGSATASARGGLIASVRDAGTEGNSPVPYYDTEHMPGAEPRTWTISQLAHDAGVNVETVRYYERIGLLRQPRKPSRGWRQYDREALRRIRFIKRGQELGFTLVEIQELLTLRGSSSPRTCESVSKKAGTKIEQIEAKVADLLAMRDVLAGLAAACPEDGAGAKCPILDALYPDGESRPLE
jgi:MerR family mercuric resistance operon transcriptional regulator